MNWVMFREKMGEKNVLGNYEYLIEKMTKK